MALHGWRLCAVTVTIIVYVISILVLTIHNGPSIRTRQYSNYRYRMSSINKRKMTINWCSELHFLYEKKNKLTDETIKNQFLEIHGTGNGTGSGLTALASFPGSGNTWLRYLLQQSTGILTGSIYKDYGLLKTGFPAENISNSSVLLIKTHEWGPNAWLQFSKAILLVRDPDKAIVAEFNRQSGGHVGFASLDRYKRAKGKFWQQFVENKLYSWEIMNLSWARNFTGTLKIIYYDELISQLEIILHSILEFLEFPINETLLNCALTRKEGIFRRKKHLLPFDPFTPAMRYELTKRKDHVYSILNEIREMSP